VKYENLVIMDAMQAVSEAISAYLIRQEVAHEEEQ
jgi:hypothetical protein